MTEGITVIGLCGRSGSGKGYVCDVFRDQGIPSVDTDKVYRDILADETSSCLSDLVTRFGRVILDSEGKLDRRVLAAIVFAESGGDDLRDLNEITHRYILEKTLEMIESAEKDGCRAIIVDAPVLFESGFDKICDMTVCVTAPDEVCIRRICSRDNRTEAEAAARLANQKREEELRALCTETVVNDGAAEVLPQVLDIISRYGL